MSDHDRSPDEIQADIRRTRGRLDEALTSIEDRLDPQRLVDQGVDYLRDHGAREYIVNLGESVRQQPLPLALVGVGLAWLMLSDQRGKTVSTRALVTTSDSGRMPDQVKSAVSGTAAGVSDTLAGARDKAVSTAADVSDTLAGARDRAVSTAAGVSNKVSGAVNDMRDKVSSRAADARDTVTRAAHQAGHTLSDGFGDARESVEHLGASARRGVERVRSGYLNVVDEQPLAIGAVGLAIGALLAASAPRTRKESELMGGASDRLKDEAKEFGRDRLEQVTEVASAAVKCEMAPGGTNDQEGAAKGKEGTVKDKEGTGASAPSHSVPASSAASSSAGTAQPGGLPASTSQAFPTKASGTSGPVASKSDPSPSTTMSGSSSAERKTATGTSLPGGTSSTPSPTPGGSATPRS